MGGQEHRPPLGRGLADDRVELLLHQAEPLPVSPGQVLDVAARVEFQALAQLAGEPRSRNPRRLAM